MKIKASHIRYIADKIVLDLINAKYIEILTNASDINKIATNCLLYTSDAADECVNV